ncbi:GtrA family protein [Halogeometricum sp. S1BR25-6]|uniref:GtrA family protein n=1 Tax=Halogeometricum salsisoli TaxID=2950536 RepID=A0ABU2GJ00_9EURY|nr:GtrA family protein [Halogeometricum sp. S1BR25-6]MDS0300238.1 GtrA family protein [Halogeometricum sp. S1BR25-6]
MATKPTSEVLLERARIGQFVSVGVVGAGIETVLVAVLTGLMGVGPLAAKAVGAEASISTMFVVNDRWTFADEGAAGLIACVRRWLKSHAVRIVGLSVAFSVLYVLTSVVSYSVQLAGFELWPTIANCIGIGIGMSINYVAESLFTWEVVGDTNV